MHSHGQISIRIPRVVEEVPSGIQDYRINCVRNTIEIPEDTSRKISEGTPGEFPGFILEELA